LILATKVGYLLSYRFNDSWKPYKQLSEARIKILKELVLARIKSFNLIEMISFVVDVMEMYYQRRLIHLANNCMDRFSGLQFCGLKYLLKTLSEVKTIYFMSTAGKSEGWFM